MNYEIKRFKNGNMNVKINLEKGDEILESFLSAVYDYDCEVWGDEFCISNFEMGICLYSWYTDMKYIVSYTDLDELEKGKTIKLYGIKLDKWDREQWAEDFKEEI